MPRASGRTTVIVWQGDGEPQQYNINVSADTSEFDDFTQDRCRPAFPTARSTSAGHGETIVLTGTREEPPKNRSAPPAWHRHAPRP